MPPILEEDTIITAPMIQRWANLYPTEYDNQHYYPWINQARAGDRDALLKITEWKNVGNGSRPMRLARTKHVSFKSFLSRLDTYRAANGRQALQQDFTNRAPVYSIFWAHVLYDSPIFDVYTHIAFAYFHPAHGGLRLTKKAAKIKPGYHWSLYADYEDWFAETLNTLQRENPHICARTLDRALFQWSKHYLHA